MLIGATDKVTKMFGKVCEAKTIDENPFYSWHLTHFIVQDEDILLFMNNATRFPLFMHHVNTESCGNLSHKFESLFRETMRYLRIPQVAIDAYFKEQKIEVCKSWDRSILSQMKDLAHIYKFNILFETHSFYRDEHASMDYADVPCIKHNIIPKVKMHEEMMRLYEQCIEAKEER